MLDDSDDKMYDEAKALLAEAKINVEYKRAQRESRMPGGLATDCRQCIKAGCTHKVFGNRIKCRTGKHSTPTQQLTKPPRPPAWPSLFDSPSTVRTLLNELGFSDSDDPASDDSDDNMDMHNEAKAPGATCGPTIYAKPRPRHATPPHPTPPPPNPTQPTHPTAAGRGGSGLPLRLWHKAACVGGCDCMCPGGWLRLAQSRKISRRCDVYELANRTAIHWGWGWPGQDGARPP